MNVHLRQGFGGFIKCKRHSVNQRRTIGVLGTGLILILNFACSQNKSHENDRHLLTGVEDTLSDPVKNRLIELRLRSKKENWGFTPVYTDLIIADVIQKTGAIIPANLDLEIHLQNLKADSILKQFPLDSLDHSFLETEIPSKMSWKKNAFDWRKLNGSTPVKDQGRCGSCWVYGTHAALEGSWRINFENEICCSEQNSLDWNNISKCNGGWPSTACDYLMRNGGVTCNDYPSGTGKGKKKIKDHPYFLRTWGYVGKKSDVPSIRALKKALVDRGPLIAGVLVTNDWGGYGDTNEVYDVCLTKPINHIVSIIGWDDSKGAWLIKNSWGTHWGSTCGYGTEKGYMWIKYNCSGIGYGAIWVLPKKVYPTIQRNKKVVEQQKIKIDEVSEGENEEEQQKGN
jgi:cathepsin L